MPVSGQTSFFNAPFFGGGFFAALVPDAPIPDEQASNWQADYWKHNPWRRRSKTDDDEATLAERIALGILPPEQEIIAAAAVADAGIAVRALADGLIDNAEAVLLAMEARESYESAYRAAYQEAYVAEAVAEFWRQDKQRITRRRKAIALLLH